MADKNYAISDNAPQKETMRITKKRIGKKEETRIKGTFAIVHYVDNDTKMHVAWMPSLDLSGYGDTIDEAFELLKAELHNLVNYLSEFSQKDLVKYLSQLGWNRDRLGHKNYSKAYVDINGELQNLNAEDNTVEKSTLQAVI